MKFIDKDLTGFRGQKFTVLRMSERRGFCICLCDCGKEFEVSVYPVLAGTRKSCGMSCGSKKHGYSGTKVWLAWQSMIQRCYNKNNEAYKNYGGRGIIVCNGWKDSFESFLADMGDPPEKLTLERKNVNGNYEPGNCVWATVKEQNRNQRNRVNLTVADTTKPVWMWAEETNQPASTIYSRIRKGWIGEEALWGRLEPRPKKPRASKPKYRNKILVALKDREWHSWMNIVELTGENREDIRRELSYLLNEDLVEMMIGKTTKHHHAKGKLWRLKQ